MKKLELLDLRYTQVSDFGCVTLAAGLDLGALPALKKLKLDRIRASALAVGLATLATLLASRRQMQSQ